MVGQAGLFSFSTAHGLREGKRWIQAICTLLKNGLRVSSCSEWRGWVNDISNKITMNFITCFTTVTLISRYFIIFIWNIEVKLWRSLLLFIFKIFSFKRLFIKMIAKSYTICHSVYSLWIFVKSFTKLSLVWHKTRRVRHWVRIELTSLTRYNTTQDSLEYPHRSNVMLKKSISNSFRILDIHLLYIIKQ